jgi:hypothetical protein
MFAGAQLVPVHRRMIVPAVLASTENVASTALPTEGVAGAVVSHTAALAAERIPFSPKPIPV